MNNTFQYKLTKNQKKEIAQNLIDILQEYEVITRQTIDFISNWILTDYSEKRKAFFDVWDIVLRNYMPTTRPILFRACSKIGKNGKIGSFTGRFEAARRFSEGKGAIIICDTKETLLYDEEFSQSGDYRYTFYPLVSVLEKALRSGGGGFSTRILNQYIGENEYIMRVDLGNMNLFRWVENNY